jgi:hypothetical protein
VDILWVIFTLLVQAQDPAQPPKTSDAAPQQPAVTAKEGATQDEIRDLRERVKRLEQQAGESEKKAPEKPGEEKGGKVFAPLDEKVKLSGEIRVRHEYRSLQDYKTIGNMRTMDDTTMSRIRLNVDMEITEWLGGNVGIQDSRVFGEEASTTSDEAGVDLHTGYMEARLRSKLDVPVMLRLGRQEMRLGSGRLMAERPWGNVGQSFDGLRITYEEDGWQAHGFMMVIREGTGSVDEDRILTGAHFTCRAVEDHTVDLYLYHRRYADETFVGEKGDTGDLRDGTAGFRGTGKTGGLDYEGELAFQFGYRGKDDVRAWMAVFRGGYTLEEWAGRPRLGIEYNYASGDNDPTDGRFGGFDDLFGLRHGVLGIADYTGRSNLHDFSAGLVIEPVKNLTLQVEGHKFCLAEKKDAWRASDLSVMRRDTSGTSDPDLATELDLITRFKAGKHFDLQLGGAWFWAGPYVEDTTGVDKDAWWCYLQATASF